jgi:hypothetical protein
MAQFVKYETSKLMHFTVSYQVGMHAADPHTNFPEDVMLVQFLLNGIFRTDMEGFAFGGDLKLDGVFGKHTHYLLLLFQRQLFQMDPAYKAVSGEVKSIGSVGGKTMEELNEWYFSGNPQVATMKDLRAVMPPGLLRKLLEFGGTDTTKRVRHGVRYE